MVGHENFNDHRSYQNLGIYNSQNMYKIIKNNVKSYKPLLTAIKYMFTVTLSIILIHTFIKAKK